MPQAEASLVESLRRWTLLLGVLQITVGCLVGIIPPGWVPWFRGIVSSHVLYSASGVMVVAFGLLARDLTLSRRELWVWFVTLQLGTWPNGTAAFVAALSGSSSYMMSSLNERFPPPNGVDNFAVTALLFLVAFVLVALGLTLLGLARRPAEPRAR